jgi:hypothetical protein
LRLPLPDEFDETSPATPEKSRADGRLHVLGIVTPTKANPALDARCWAFCNRNVLLLTLTDEEKML